MSLTLYHNGEEIIKVERQGQAGSLGSFIEAYERRPDGSFVGSWYADHTCSLDVFDVPVEHEKIPLELFVWLGQPLARFSSAQEKYTLKPIDLLRSDA